MNKILIYMQNLAGDGAERTIVNLINNMDYSNFEVVLILDSKQKNEYIHMIKKNIIIDYLNVDSNIKKVLSIRKKLQKFKPDLIFTTMLNNNLLLLLANLLTLKKYRAVVRVANNRSINNQVKLGKKILVYLAYNYIAEKVIALSKGVKEDLIQNFKIESTKIDVIYNPIDILNIHSKMNEPVEGIDFKNSKTIIAVGRLVEQKDYSTLLNAFKLVADIKKNVKLIILGKGPLFQKLIDETKNLNLNDKVEFLGFIENPYKYISKSDLFVLSSIHEGFGHVIAEALTCGTPVISTDCKSGPSEIILDNEFGVLVPVRDINSLAVAIVRLLEDEEKRAKLAVKGKERALDFDAKKITNAYERLFVNVINAKNE